MSQIPYDLRAAAQRQAQGGRPANPANDPCRVRLDGVIVAYAEGLTKARAFDTGEPKFGASFIAWGTGAGVMQDKVDEAMMAAATGRWGPDKRQWPPRLRGISKEPVIKLCRDFPNMLPDGPPDATFVRANSSTAPGIVDAQGQALTLQEAANMLFSGWFVNVSMRAFAFSHASGDGVSLGLQNVQLVRPGKRLGGRASATSEFGPVTDEQLRENNDNPFGA
jgi:hypothetical protein